MLAHVGKRLSSGGVHQLKHFLSVRTVNLAIGIKEGKPQFMSKINADKSDWQESSVDLLPALGVFIDPRGGITRSPVTRGVNVMLTDRRKPMIRGHKDIRIPGSMRV